MDAHRPPLVDENFTPPTVTAATAVLRGAAWYAVQEAKGAQDQLNRVDEQLEEARRLVRLLRSTKDLPVPPGRADGNGAVLAAEQLYRTRGGVPSTTPTSSQVNRGRPSAAAPPRRPPPQQATSPPPQLQPQPRSRPQRRKDTGTSETPPAAGPARRSERIRRKPSLRRPAGLRRPTGWTPALLPLPEDAQVAAILTRARGSFSEVHRNKGEYVYWCTGCGQHPRTQKSNKLPLSRESFRRLLGTNFLEDLAINAWLARIEQRSMASDVLPKVRCMTSFASTYLVEGREVPGDWGERMRERIRLKDARYVMFPTNTSAHWYLICVDLLEKIIKIYDSLSDPDAYHQGNHAPGNILDVIMNWLDGLADELKPDGFDATEWSCEVMPECPRQVHTHCGVYMMKFIDSLSRGIDPALLGPMERHMPYFRQRTIHELLLGDGLLCDDVVVGLENVGNTCYKNSVLQYLFATEGLRGLYLGQRAVAATHNATQAGGGDPVSQACAEFGKLVQNLWARDALQELWYVETSNFVEAWAGAARECGLQYPPGRQEDACEFLQHLLDVLGSENPAVADAFRSVRIWQTTCGQCNFVSVQTVVETSVAAHLDLPELPQGVGVGSLELGQCIAATDVEEEVEWRCGECCKRHCGVKCCCEQDWVCGDTCTSCKRKMGIHPGCRGAQPNIRKGGFTQMPEYLVIGLKRFEHSGGVGGQRKNATPVRFDEILSDEDLRGLYAEGHAPAELPQYELYAVVYHHGRTPRGGHYTASAKSRHTGEWHRLDDAYSESESACPGQEADLGRKDRAGRAGSAYILFYAKRP